MVLCLRLTVRRIVLRTLLLSLLAIGIASAARVKHTVDLPTNPLHCQRYLKTLRSVLATQRLGLRYEVPAPTPGAPAGVKYADSEDYFRAAPAYNKPADIPQHSNPGDHPGKSRRSTGGRFFRTTIVNKIPTLQDLAMVVCALTSPFQRYTVLLWFVQV